MINDRLPKTLFPFIWFFLREYKFIVALYIFLAISAGFWGPFNSILVKKVLNALPDAKSHGIEVLFIPASFIVINFIIFDNITWRGITYIRAKYIPEIINKMYGLLLDHALGKSYQFYLENLSGKVAKQIGNFVDGVDALITTISSNFLRGGSVLVTAFVASYFVNPIFCLILFCWFVVFAGVSIAMSKKLVLLSATQASEEALVTGEVVDALSNQGNVRIFAARSHEISRIIPFFGKQKDAYSATYLYSMVLHSIQGALISIMMGFMVYFLSRLYINNLITVGDFALILGLSMETGHMMWFTMAQVDEFNKVVGRCKESLAAFSLPLEIKDEETAQNIEVTKGRIIFNKVEFNYKDTEPLFQDKSIEILPAQKVGLVGYSGSGKSTFVNLIQRFYDVTSGSILIDEFDIKKVTQDSLRKNISVIPQEPTLFNRSLMENIRYGRTNADDDEVIEAAKKAHAHEFISALPQGYDSLVGERGVKLSGGQRQRIAIARAILKNAPILILDEATSQLDSISENMIQESLLDLMHRKTTIVIAHRLSTLLRMDRILVFDKGKIVEDGTHSELLAKAGLYKQLWDTQIGGFLGDI